MRSKQLSYTRITPRIIRVLRGSACWLRRSCPPPGTPSRPAPCTRGPSCPRARWGRTRTRPPPAFERQRGDFGPSNRLADAAISAAALQQPGHRHRDDAILVGEARTVAGVVLQIQVAEPQLRAQAVGADQRRVAGVGRPTRACADASTIGKSSSKCQMFCGRSAPGTSLKWLAASS